jgi:hypothetical protein
LGRQQDGAGRSLSASPRMAAGESGSEDGCGSVAQQLNAGPVLGKAVQGRTSLLASCTALQLVRIGVQLRGLRN